MAKFVVGLICTTCGEQVNSRSIVCVGVSVRSLESLDLKGGIPGEKKKKNSLNNF